jgi:hypothetical protein
MQKIMTQSFLDLSAEYLIKTHSEQFDKVNIILPTRRSGQELEALLLSKGAKKIPVISHIEDFISQNTEGTKTNSILLLLELFDVFQQVDPTIRLEKFTSWGYILLKDFDLIDRNLVDAKKLFANLADIKNIDKWRIGEEHITPKIGEYFQLWENLQIVYERFKEKLQEQEMAYSGMLYQQLAENAKTRLVQHPDFVHFVFLGFNALSKSEEMIFKTLLDAKKAEVIWDADSYYMKPNDENKAGFFLRKYKKNWSNTHWFFQSEYLAQNAKNITVLSVANASMQGKVANQLIKNELENNKESSPQPTALVLGDEHLLLPVLHSLDEELQGLNICMGLSLKDSALFNLVDILFEQQQTLIRDRNTDELKFNHRSIIKLFNHPFVRQFEKIHCPPEEEYERRNLLLMLTYHINQHNMIFIGAEELLQITEHESFLEKRREDEHLDAYCEHAVGVLRPLFEVLFQRWKNPFEAIDAFKRIAEMLVNEDNYLEKAYFKEFDELLGLLKGFISRRAKVIDMRTFKIFMYQAFREAHFDFDSDRKANLQLMGINETRNLDFKNVIILSVNETVLPRSKRVNSFIPIDVAKAFELPTYSEQDAVVSYHFYRLLQRAENISLVYVSPSDTYGGKEKSRFILQLENDLVRYNPLIKIKEKTVKFRPAPEAEEMVLLFEKTEVEIEKIKENLKNGLSPSHINSFINCSLQYYFRQISKIRKTRGVEETLGADKLGTLVHEILEDIFRELSQPSHFVDAPALEKVMPTVMGLVEDKLASEQFAGFVLTGSNYIVKEVATQYIQQFLSQQIEEINTVNSPFEILTLENKDIEEEMGKFRQPMIEVEFQIEVNDEVIPIKIHGITDRVDKFEGAFRVIDYKTGKVEARHLKTDASQTEVLVHDPKSDKIRQLWLYKFIITKQILMQGSLKIGHHTLDIHSPLKVGIYSLRNLAEGFQEIKPSAKTDSIFPENSKQFVEVSENLLAEIVANMLDPEKPFEQTEDLKICEYCDFKGICNR